MYWDRKNVGCIASMTGKPMRVDGVTDSLGRIAYARVCVRINLAKQLLSSVCVQSKFRRFQ